MGKKVRAVDDSVRAFPHPNPLPQVGEGADRANTGVQSSIITTLWHSRCNKAARLLSPGSIDHYVTGVSERSQRSYSTKDDAY